MKNSLAVFIIATLLNLTSSVFAQETPDPKTTTEFLQLHRADAKEVANIVTNLVEAKKPEALGQEQGRHAGVNPELAASFLSKENRINGSVKLTADTRTNRIKVETLPENLPSIRSLVDGLEADFSTRHSSGTGDRLQKSPSK